MDAFRRLVHAVRPWLPTRDEPAVLAPTPKGNGRNILFLICWWVAMELLWAVSNVVISWMREQHLLVPGHILRWRSGTATLSAISRASTVTTRSTAALIKSEMLTRDAGACRVDHMSSVSTRWRRPAIVPAVAPGTVRLRFNWR